MLSVNPSNSNDVRVVMHVSPSVYVAGLVAAQQRGLRQRDFLEQSIVAACASGAPDPGAEPPWSRHAIVLFMTIADLAPELLEGPWKSMYAKITTDESLWIAPESTAEESEDGLFQADGWRISKAALEKAWPRLVCNAFGH